MDDFYNLNRFVEAQAPVYERVLSELRQARKQSHWMWFVFPQLKGLGQSSMALRYGIVSIEEARAYLEHPVLGARLRECVRLLNGLEGHSIEEIFGYPDDLKFRSSVTLFAQAASDNWPFLEALGKYFGQLPDPITLGYLGQQPPNA